MDSQHRKKLTDILNGGGGNFADTWNNTAAAGDDGPIPPGTYTCYVASLHPRQSRSKNTPGISLVFEVLEGEYAGRRVWHSLWLTPAAIPRAKRDLAKIGITRPEQIDQPLPRGIRCSIVVVLRKTDEGVDYNEVRRFECLGVDAPESNPFPPDDAADDDADPGIPV